MTDTAQEPGEASVGESAYRRVRTDILFGRLLPGQKLGLDRLRGTYGTSVSTLRELLNRLSSEGLVLAEGARGFEVARVAAAEFRELAQLRLLLEGDALGRSFEAGGLEWEGGVVAAHHKLAAVERSLIAGEAADPRLWKRYDWEFHRALIAGCRSKVLLEAHAAAYDRYLRYQMVAVVFRGAVAAEEHQRLLECALRRDAPAARAILESHLTGCVEHVVRTGALDRFAEAGRRADPGGNPRPTAPGRKRSGTKTADVARPTRRGAPVAPSRARA